MANPNDMRTYLRRQASPRVNRKSSPWGFRQKLGIEITFEPAPGQRTLGDIYEVGVDGSFLVRPRRVPKAWSWDDLHDARLGRMVPTFFLVDFNPRSASHRLTHRQVGYEFDPTRLGKTLVERISNLSVQIHNPSAKARAWYAEQIRQLGVALEADYRTFSVTEYGKDWLYFTVADGVYDAKVGRFCRLENDGTVTEILRAPGRVLTAFPHPLDRQHLLVSAEGYPKDDPRWQCLYELNLRTSDYRVVEFPKPAGNDLHGSKIRFFPEQGIALLNRYGFVPEGGGLWLFDPYQPDYQPVRRLLGWDHSQVWLFFPTPDWRVMNVLFTAKEVDNDFTMTVNRAVLHLNGLNTQLTEPTRIAKVKGWNPIPFHTEPIGTYRHLIYVASNSHEDYLASRPSGVYVFEVSA